MIMTTHTKSTKTTKSTKPEQSTPAAPPADTSTAAAQNVSVLQAAPTPPTEHAPAVPTNFDLTQRVGRGAGIWPTLATLAAPMATEVQSSSTFADDFGSKVDQAGFAQTLAYAAAWRAEWEAAKDWLLYVRVGTAAAVKAAQKKLERFRGAFEHAESLDPTIAKRYAQLNELYRSQSARGTRAANTRANKKKAKEAATTASDAASTTTHVAVTTPPTTTT